MSEHSAEGGVSSASRFMLAMFCNCCYSGCDCGCAAGCSLVRHKSVAESTPDMQYVCPRCQRSAPWTDGTMVAAGDDRDEFWCQTCGAETPLTDCEVRP